MLVVLCLSGEAQQARVHSLAVGVALVAHAYDVGSQLRNDGAHLQELSRFVVKLYAERADASALRQTAVDDAVENGDVDVAATHDARRLLALDRHLVEHHGSHASSAGTLCHHLLSLKQMQDGSTDLVLAHRHDVVDIT